MQTLRAPISAARAGPAHVGELLRAHLALARQHPARVLGRQLARRVEPRELVGSQLDLGRADVVGKLLGLLRADDDARDGRLVQQPGERDLRDRDVARVRDLAHRVDAVERAVLVQRRKVERGAPAVRLALAVAAVLAAQEPAGERAPDEQREAFALQHRHELALEVAAGDRVVRLQALEAREAEPLGDAERLHDLPGRPVGDADVADVAVPDHRVERAHRLLDRRRRIEAVDLVEVDVVELQALQARLQPGDDVAARRTAHVRARARLAEHLGRDDDALARNLEILQRLPGDLLRPAARVDIGGVDEVDAGVERAADDALRVVLLQPADLSPQAFTAAAERHRAEAELGDEHAGATERVELHRDLLQRAPNDAFSNRSLYSRGCERQYWCGATTRAPSLAAACHGQRGS